MNLHERLRQAIELLPPDAAVSLPVPLMRELLDSVACSESVTDDDGHDLTVAEVAARLHRPRSTVRSWVKAGRFAGTYKLSERDWRVPSASVAAFVEARRPAVTSPSTDSPVRRRPHRTAGRADLAAWREQS